MSGEISFTPSSSRFTIRTTCSFFGSSGCFAQGPQHVLPVLTLAALLRQAPQGCSVDEAHSVGNLLEAGDRRALAPTERSDEVARVQQALLSAGIEPGKPSRQDLETRL